jgi:NAD(P)-dependent dehydrogenase (short-subunit alcohol dehydrogenase family)
MRNVNGRNAAAAREIRELAERESLSMQTVELDVTDDLSVERAVSKIALQCGRIDVLVNNAGFGIMDLSVTLAQAKRQFDTNFFGVLRMNRAVLPAMRRQGNGLLLHVSSGAGRLAIPGMGLYCASKFAMEALAEVYRYELASLGIDSVVIEPGAYATPIMEKLARGEESSRKTGYGEMAQIPERIRAKIASSRANPQEIADAVLRIIETPADNGNSATASDQVGQGFSASSRLPTKCRWSYSKLSGLQRWQNSRQEPGEEVSSHQARRQPRIVMATSRRRQRWLVCQRKLFHWPPQV